MPLRPHTGGAKTVNLNAATVGAAIAGLVAAHPALKIHLYGEDGKLRNFVNIYLGDEDGVLHAIDRGTGKRLWIFATDAEIAGCVAMFGNNLLLASHDSYLYCVTTEGKEVWKFQTNDRINCSPGIADTYTFLAGCDEHLRVIDLNTGKEFRDMPLESFLIA